MYKGLKIAVSMPAYNEELLILEAIGNVPDYVDYIFVVNDSSSDRTGELVASKVLEDKRVVLTNHEKNKGLGSSLITGYLKSLDSDADITAVMAGDNQMHPDDLPTLLDAIIDDGFDYAKGNRLLHTDIESMPKYRFIGNSVLTILTKFATGYYHIMDPAVGLHSNPQQRPCDNPIEQMTRGYGYNADILCMLNIQGYTATDVEIRPVYDREISKIKLWKYIPKTSWILFRLFFRRLWKRYVVLDFHPLVLFYVFAMFCLLFLALPFSIRFVYFWVKYGELARTTMNIIIFTTLLSFQSILFAIWMDMDYNYRRRKNG